MLIDVLIGIALIAAGIGGATILVFGGQSALIDRGTTTEARVFADEGVKGMRLYLKDNWDTTPDGTYGVSLANGVWAAATGTPTTRDIYTRSVSLRTLDADRKEITSTVTWSAGPGRLLKVEFTTLLTNWKELASCPADSGGTAASGDWRNPRTLGSVDLGAGNEATGLDVRKKIVYVSAKASTVEKPDFFIIDATNGQSPSVLSRLHTGPGLNGIDVEGRYAYVISRDDDNHFQIIDICDRNNPRLVSTLDLGAADRALSVLYHNSKVYIGADERSGAAEFFVVDVSNPQSPRIDGSLEIGAHVNAISATGTVAYIATPLANELSVIDVSQPSNPRIVGSYAAPGDSEDGKSLFVAGNRLYLGRIWGAKHTYHHELHVLDITTTSTPQNLGSRDLATDLNDLVVNGNLAFLATNLSNGEFQVWNISNPQNIVLWSSLNFPQIATGIDYEDNVVYVSVRSNDGLRIVSSAP